MVAAEPAVLRRFLRRLRPWWRTILRALVFAGPTLLLVPLGILWLWERGWMLWWLLACTAGVMLAVAAARLWTPDLPPVLAKAAAQGAPPGEIEARARIARIGEAVTAADIADVDAAQALAARLAHEVASVFHPGEAKPTLRVTVPELLLVTEQTSADLRRRLLGEFPILRDIRFDLLEDGQGLLQWADRAMLAYRVGRFLFNPANALVQEFQRMATNMAGKGMGDFARKRIAQILVQEFGEAAIRLYSGAARLDSREMTEASVLDAGEAVAAPTETREPLRAVLVGQVNAGKSSLVNALSGTAQALSGAGIHTDSALDVPAAHELHGPLLLTDTVGLRGDARVELGVLTGADLLLWPVALHRADRGADLRALQALRDWAATHPSRSPPPIVFVATHADRLEPSGEWAPPYDTAGTGRKEQSIAAALAAAKAALAWPEARWVPAALGGVPAWNIEGIRTAIAAARPEAEASRALRLRAVRGTVARAADAARTLRGAGRVLRGEALRGVPDRITRLFPKREG